MSYITDDFKLKQRRHPVQRLAPEAVTVDKLNAVVDEANDRLARILAYSKNLEAQVTLLFEENKALRGQVAGLEKENARLKKLIRPKAGQRKGEELEAFNEKLPRCDRQRESEQDPSLNKDT